MNQEIENWKPIKGYELHYEVSDLGRVRSISRFVPFMNSSKFCPGKIKKSTRHHKNKYHSVILKVEQEEKRVSLSRLVAEHFIPNPYNKPEVNHILGDKDDNRAIMLEWSTPVENAQHAIKIGLTRNRIPVILIKDTAIIEFESIKKASKYIGIDNQWLGKSIKNNFEVRGFKGYYL
jgi:hypothetical protein